MCIIRERPTNNVCADHNDQEETVDEQGNANRVLSFVPDGVLVGCLTLVMSGRLDIKDQGMGHVAGSDNKTLHAFEKKLGT